MSRSKRKSGELILIKAAQVWPFVNTISRHGGDVSALAKQAGLPLDAVTRKEGLIGERSAWRFIGFAAQTLGIEQLGHLVAVEHPIRSSGELGGMRLRMATNLERLLQFFIEDVKFENNGANYSLEPDGERIMLRREVPFPDCIGSWQTEQYMVTVLMQIIGLCSAPSARPLRIGLSSNASPLPVPAAWSGIDIDWGCTATEVSFGADLLQMPVGSGIERLEQHHHRVSGAPVSFMDIHYIVDRQIWSGGAKLEAAARELGISSSTLKRRLSEGGRAFSDIVGERRQYWAERLLAETGTPITDIAKTLGYAHLSNFTRAFRTRTGVTPKEFRKSRRSAFETAHQLTA